MRETDRKSLARERRRERERTREREERQSEREKERGRIETDKYRTTRDSITQEIPTNTLFPRVGE